jgi:hypothetical protein
MVTDIAAVRPLYEKWQATGESTDEEIYKAAKKKLPGFTFSGSFTRRAIDGLNNYSKIIQADFDKLKSKDIDIDDLRRKINADPIALFSFVSPSGDGLKVGVRVVTGPEHHLEAFLGMQRYFESTYGIRPDDSCKDVSRNCFLSSDPNIFINEDARPLNWTAWPAPVEVVEEEPEHDLRECALDALPPIIRRMTSACAEVYVVDETMPALAALTVLGAALGGMVRCENAVNGRSTPCNIYSVIGAPSGYGKSAVSVLAKPLTDASGKVTQNFIMESHPRLSVDIRNAKAELQSLGGKLRGEELTPKGREEAVARQVTLEASIARWERELLLPPSYFTGSATGAALARELERNGEQLLSLAYEAGDAIRVAAGRYSSDGKGDYDLLLSGYSGEPFAESRISRDSTRLDSPCLSILWTVQPSLLDELMGTTEAQERGLLARMCPVRVGHDIWPHDDGVFREIPLEVETEWASLIAAALDLRKDERQITFYATDTARQVFRTWHNEAVALRNADQREQESRLARCRETAIRIALIIAALDWLEKGATSDKPSLQPEHAVRGVTITRFLTDSALHISGIAAAGKRAQRLEWIVKLLRESGGRVTIRNLRDHHGIGPEEIRQIVSRNPKVMAVEEGIVGRKGGRPASWLKLLKP